MTEDDRVKQREEARKERMQLARAAKLPHVHRNEYKVLQLHFTITMHGWIVRNYEL